MPSTRPNLAHEIKFHRDAIKAMRQVLIPAATLPELKTHLTAVLPAFEHHLAAALPAAMQTEIAQYFGDQIDWLTRLLAHGRKTGDFAFAGTPAKQAALVFSAIEGLLLIHRTGREAKEVSAVLSLIKDGLKT